MKTEQLRHLKTFVEHYGVYSQQIKTIEECSELIKAICKCEDMNTIIDEIADVEIMINQLKVMFECFGEVEDRIDFKIKRQLERIKNEV